MHIISSTIDFHYLNVIPTRGSPVTASKRSTAIQSRPFSTETRCPAFNRIAWICERKWILKYEELRWGSKTEPVSLCSVGQLVGKVTQNRSATQRCEVMPLLTKKVNPFLRILCPAAHQIIKFKHTFGMTKHLNKVAFKFSMSRAHSLKFQTDLRTHCSSRHQIACFKATEVLHTSPPPPYRAAQSHKCTSVARFATLRVLICFHSPVPRCSCCNVVWFCCDLEACNLVTATVFF
jgi:hypothetical protein